MSNKNLIITAQGQFTNAEFGVLAFSIEQQRMPESQLLAITVPPQNCSQLYKQIYLPAKIIQQQFFQILGVLIID